MMATNKIIVSIVIVFDAIGKGNTNEMSFVITT